MEGKIVRDKIIEIIKSSGETPIYRRVSIGESIDYLCEKVIEELEEFKKVKDNEDRTLAAEELGDVLEVIFSIGLRLNITPDILAEFAASKRADKGSFDENWVLIGKEPKSEKEVT